MVAASPRAPDRLRKRREFLRVARDGSRAASTGVVVQDAARMPQDGGPARVGFTVTRKVGNAVVRNRTRRRLREAARVVFGAPEATARIAGRDFVLIGRDATRHRRFSTLIEDLRRALDRAAAEGAPVGHQGSASRGAKRGARSR